MTIEVTWKRAYAHLKTLAATTLLKTLLSTYPRTLASTHPKALVATLLKTLAAALMNFHTSPHLKNVKKPGSALQNTEVSTNLKTFLMFVDCPVDNHIYSPCICIETLVSIIFLN